MVRLVNRAIMSNWWLNLSEISLLESRLTIHWCHNYWNMFMENSHIVNSGVRWDKKSQMTNDFSQLMVMISFPRFKISFRILFRKANVSSILQIHLNLAVPFFAAISKKSTASFQTIHRILLIYILLQLLYIIQDISFKILFCLFPIIIFYERFTIHFE